MRRSLLTAFAALTLGCSHSAPPLSTPPRDSAEASLIAESLRGETAWNVLATLTDQIGARPSGSPALDEAITWTTATFRQWGLDVHQEPVMVPHWARGEERARIVSPASHNVVITALGGSAATPAGGITAEVIEVATLERLAELGDSVKGKIVFFNAPMDLELVRAGHAFDAYSKVVPNRGKGPNRAAAAGAAATLVRSIASASLRTPHTGATRWEEGIAPIPAASITTEDADLIHRLLALGKAVTLHLVLTPHTYPDAPSANVVAEIRGRELPDEIVLIGAHLDSWDLGTGAIDNGSGAASVMEAMRLIAKHGAPRRTVRGVLFTNEEHGLKGGKGYLAAHESELASHVAAIELDAGAATPVALWTTLPQTSFPVLSKELGFVQSIAPISFVYSESTGADTSPLTEKKVVGFGLVPDPRHYFDYHHTPADTLDKVVPRELNQNVALLTSLAWHLAEHGLPVAP